MHAVVAAHQVHDGVAESLDLEVSAHAVQRDVVVHRVEIVRAREFRTVEVAQEESEGEFVVLWELERLLGCLRGGVVFGRGHHERLLVQTLVDGAGFELLDHVAQDGRGIREQLRVLAEDLVVGTDVDDGDGIDVDLTGEAECETVSLQAAVHLLVDDRSDCRKLGNRNFEFGIGRICHSSQVGGVGEFVGRRRDQACQR